MRENTLCLFSICVFVLGYVFEVFIFKLLSALLQTPGINRGLGIILYCCVYKDDILNKANTKGNTSSPSFVTVQAMFFENVFFYNILYNNCIHTQVHECRIIYNIHWWPK